MVGLIQRGLQNTSNDALEQKACSKKAYFTGRPFCWKEKGLSLAHAPMLKCTVHLYEGSGSRELSEMKASANQSGRASCLMCAFEALLEDHTSVSFLLCPPPSAVANGFRARTQDRLKDLHGGVVCLTQVLERDVEALAEGSELPYRGIARQTSALRPAGGAMPGPSAQTMPRDHS